MDTTEARAERGAKGAGAKDPEKKRKKGSQGKSNSAGKRSGTSKGKKTGGSKEKGSKNSKGMPETPESKKRSSKSKLKKGVYEYQKLTDLFSSEKKNVNIYAVIMDASAPYYMEKTGKYLCTMKLIDETCYPGIAGKDKKEILKATFFSRKADGLPNPNKIGTIIRIHRADTRKHKSTMQLNCDYGIKGAWALFDMAESNQQSFSHTGGSYTFDANDKARLKQLKAWLKKYFSEHEFTGESLKEAINAKKQDFDFMGLVLDVKKKDKEGVTRIRLCDADKIVKLDVASGRNPYIAPQEVVRVRSANVATSKKESGSEEPYLTLNEYSNILRVPKEFKSAALLHDSIKGSKQGEKYKSVVSMYTPSLEKQVSATKILSTHKQTKTVKLKELFGGETPSGKFFKINANVIEIGPKDPREWINIVDTKTQKQYKVSEVFAKGKKITELPKGMEYYYKLQLFVKDQSVKDDTNLYIVFLCSIEGRGKEFFKLNLGREKPEEKHYKELKRIYKMLTRPWTTVDLMVEVVNVSGGQPIFFIVDTELTI